MTPFLNKIHFQNSFKIYREIVKIVQKAFLSPHPVSLILNFALWWTLAKTNEPILTRYYQVRFISVLNNLNFYLMSFTVPVSHPGLHLVIVSSQAPFDCDSFVDLFLMTLQFEECWSGIFVECFFTGVCLMFFS